MQKSFPRTGFAAIWSANYKPFGNTLLVFELKTVNTNDPLRVTIPDMGQDWTRVSKRISACKLDTRLWKVATKGYTDPVYNKTLSLITKRQYIWDFGADSVISVLYEFPSVCPIYI